MLKVVVNSPEALISTDSEALIVTSPPSPLPSVGLSITDPSRIVNRLVSIAISPALPAPAVPVNMPLWGSVISAGSCAAPGSRTPSRKSSNPIPLSSIFSAVRIEIGPPAPFPIVPELRKAPSKRLNPAASILMPRPSMLPMVSDARIA